MIGGTATAADGGGLGAAIVVSDADGGLRRDVLPRLMDAGYTVTGRVWPSEPARLVGRDGIDLAVVDPGASCWPDLRDFCAHPFWQATGLLLVSRGGGPAERTQALLAGAADVVAPYDLPELLARIEARLRERSRRLAGADAEAAERLLLGSNYILDRAGQRLIGPTVTWPLASREYRLLLVFLAHEGAVLSRSQLARAAWGDDHEEAVRNVDRYVATLRQKLGDGACCPRYLLTHRNEGYSFHRQANGNVRDSGHAARIGRTMRR